MKMRLIEHTMVTSFDVSLTSPEKVSSVVFHILESLKKHKRRLHWGTFFEDSLVGSKKGKLAPIRHLFKTILTSVIKTRSLDNFFIFKEFEKRITMDSIKNVLLD